MTEQLPTLLRDNALQSLVYSSAAVGDFGEAELTELLAHAREHNSRVGVTGMLLFRDGRFIQFLEGVRSEVQALFTKIEADPRHEQVRVLLDEPIWERQFTEWTMGYQSIRPPSAPVPSGFRDTFEDLESAADHLVTSRAARELTVWFRVRDAQRGRPTAA